jgi:hypothetical protein
MSVLTPLLARSKNLFTLLNKTVVVVDLRNLWSPLARHHGDSQKVQTYEYVLPDAIQKRSVESKRALMCSVMEFAGRDCVEDCIVLILISPGFLFSLFPCFLAHAPVVSLAILPYYLGMKNVV